jgi:ERCC4-type nuclease
MFIKIDNRETELIRCCKYFLEISPSFKDITIIIENLPIGDIILCKDGVDKVIIERKSLRDLAASIKDGRYEEQSYRLNGLPMHNHNILYLIEGDVNKFNVFKDRMEKMTMYSAMVSLNYYKGFSVMRSLNIEESALILCNMAYKINKSELEKKMPFYSNQLLKKEDHNDNIIKEINTNDIKNNIINDINDIINEEPENYCTVVKKIKKENITPKNIGEIMLCQIPGISSTTAIAIMDKFTTLQNLIIKIKEDDNCLKNISYTNSKGQTRKVNKTALNNIITYLKNP